MGTGGPQKSVKATSRPLDKSCLKRPPLASTRRATRIPLTATATTATATPPRPATTTRAHTITALPREASTPRTAASPTADIASELSPCLHGQLHGPLRQTAPLLNAMQTDLTFAPALLTLTHPAQLSELVHWPAQLPLGGLRETRCDVLDVMCWLSDDNSTATRQYLNSLLLLLRSKRALKSLALRTHPRQISSLGTKSGHRMIAHGSY